MGRPLALIVGAALPAIAAFQAPPAPAVAPAQVPDPLPRVAIGGLRALDCASTVVYAGAPANVHKLHAAYAFPDRARWWIGIGEENAPQRQMRFRYGSRLYAIDPGASAYRRLEGDAGAEAFVQLEMRRALLLWPDGFEWKRTGAQGSVALGAFGTLTARFADARGKEPGAFVFARADGQIGDEFRAIAWREENGRSWPVKLELWHQGTLVWRETIDRIDTQSRFIDSYYLPPDQRTPSAGTPLEVGTVRALDLPEIRSRRIPLESGASWDKARVEWARLTAEQNAEWKSAGVSLDDKATFEVSDELQPLAVLLRLASAHPAHDPALEAAWPLTAERPGLSTFVLGLAALKPDLLARVRKAVPSDAHAGLPYVRFDPARPDQHVLVVLPLAPGDG